MKLTSKAKAILGGINSENRPGDLRKIAKEIKKDHGLSLELWSTGEFLPRLLSILLLDHKLITKELLNEFDKDMQAHSFDERNHLMDWLMANQLTTSKSNISLMLSWKNSPSALQRRAFWYYQGRLRWTGQVPPGNTAELLSDIESTILKEAPEVQWVMNFTAGWMDVYDKKYRNRCIKLGEQTGLYKDEMVSKGCTPNYLPAFIAIETDKRNL